MKILVDTSVWSLALRRKDVKQKSEVRKLEALIKNGEQIYILGIILQEILSGIKDERLFNKLADYLSAFPLIELTRKDYIKAAQLRNICMKKGISASTIDFLIASICIGKDMLLFSADSDFQHIARVSNLKLTN